MCLLTTPNSSDTLLRRGFWGKCAGLLWLSNYSYFVTLLVVNHLDTLYGTNSTGAYFIELNLFQTSHGGRGLFHGNVSPSHNKIYWGLFHGNVSQQLTSDGSLLCCWGYLERIMLNTIKQLGFSYFEFTNRLGLSFQKQKFLYLNSQPIDSQSGVITITPKSQLWMGDIEKLSVTFSHAWLILVEFT